MFDWIVITSPEAASVFLDGWRKAGFPEARLAVVGVGTGQVFEKVELENTKLSIDFVPSKANAKILAEELPKLLNGREKVLYPASAKASNELEMGLSARGFEVIRLNTYSTEAVKFIDSSILEIAISSPVVALASPTAVRAWVDVIDVSTWSGAAACIGQTSAVAAQKAGLKRVFYPENPGIEGSLSLSLSLSPPFFFLSPQKRTVPFFPMVFLFSLNMNSSDPSASDLGLLTSSC
ncbi:hypothetical protein KP509_10G001000 [Ceratopteris richardii]|nr:hypothetical protein KP509_10G001000 [Ceratopteris richardii]